MTRGRRGYETSQAIKIVWKQEASDRRIGTVVEGFATVGDAQKYADDCLNLRLAGASITTIGKDQNCLIDLEEVIIWDDITDVQLGYDIAVEWLSVSDFERGSVTVFERKRPT